VSESIDICKSQRLRTEGNARIIKVSAIRSGLAMIIKKVYTSNHSETLETDLNVAWTASCIDYTDTWSLKRVHSLSNRQSTTCGTTNCGCEDTVEFNSAVGWASQPIMRIPLQVAQETRIQRLLATLYITERIDCCQLHHGTSKAMLLLDLVDAEEVYG